MIKNIHESVNEMRSVKAQLKAYAKLLEKNTKAEELVKKGKELIKRIETWEQNLIQPKQKTFQDVINYNNQLNAELMYLKGFVDSTDPKVTQGAKERLKDLRLTWSAFEKEQKDIVKNEMDAYNKMYRSMDLPALIIEKI